MSLDQQNTSVPDDLHARFVSPATKARLRQHAVTHRQNAVALLKLYATQKQGPASSHADFSVLPPYAQKLSGRCPVLFPGEVPAGISPLNGQNRWMLPYADMITLLLGVFMLLFYTQTPEVPPPKLTERAGLNALVIENTMFQNRQLQTEQAKQILQKSLKLNGTRILQAPQGLLIRIPEQILFSAGSDTLTPKAQQALDEVSGVIRKLDLNVKNRSIQIEGHTDNTPVKTHRFPSNWELSTSRSIQILKYLTAQHHFSPSQLSAVGYAEYRPIAENSTIEGKQKNRRVDIVIVDTSFHQATPQPAHNEHATSSHSDPAAASEFVNVETSHLREKRA